MRTPTTVLEITRPKGQGPSHRIGCRGSAAIRDSSQSPQGRSAQGMARSDCDHSRQPMRVTLDATRPLASPPTRGANEGSPYIAPLRSQRRMDANAQHRPGRCNHLLATRSFAAGTRSGWMPGMGRPVASQPSIPLGPQIGLRCRRRLASPASLDRARKKRKHCPSNKHPTPTLLGSICLLAHCFNIK